MKSKTKTNLNFGHRITWKISIIMVLFGFVSICNAIPTILKVEIVTDASGSWSNNTRPAPVNYATSVNLRALIKVSGAPHTYYWGYSGTTMNIDGTNTTVYQWCWDTPTIEWLAVYPSGQQSSGSNDPWNPSYPYYTNVVEDQTSGNNVACPHGHLFANPPILTYLGNPFTYAGTKCISPGCTCPGCSGGTHTTCRYLTGVQSRTFEGNCCAIIEYIHYNAGTGWGVTDYAYYNGVSHYTISFTFNSNTYYSLGRYYSSTTSKLIYDTSSSEQAYDRGIGGSNLKVTRIVRLGSNSSNYLKHVESYAWVPWVYGSWSWQAKEYIGFDCADLAQAAAYNAGLDSVYQNSASNLASTHTKIGVAYEPYSLVSGVLKKSGGSDASITIGTDIHFGDLIMLDHDGNGTVDHTTILYNKGTNLLSGDDTFICAGHDGTTSGVVTRTLNQEQTTYPDMKIYLREGW